MERRTWSIIGDATGGNDRDLTWNDTTQALEINTPLTAGTI